MSTKEFGCFFCEGKGAQREGVCDKCGELLDISKQLVDHKIDVYTVTGVLGRGFFGWTVLAKDELQQFAIKLIPRHRLSPKPVDEQAALAQCSPHRNIARFWRVVDVELQLGDSASTVDVVGLVFEYIPGAVTLREFIESDEPLTKHDVVALLRGVALGLARMHKNELWHNDLHDDNILVRRVEPDEDPDDRYEAKLIDFGSAKKHADSEGPRAEEADYYYLAKHLLAVAEAFLRTNHGHLTAHDRAFARRLRRISVQIGDPDANRRNFEPASLAAAIGDAIGHAMEHNDLAAFQDMLTARLSISEPLQNSNALNLAPQDIEPLFCDELAWRNRIIKAAPVIIVGPRGCGKTMLLRSLSIISLARPRKDEKTPDDVRSRLEGRESVGFLINVAELRTPFLRSSFMRLVARDAALAGEFCREYITAQFAYHVLAVTSWLAEERLMTISRDDLDSLQASVRALLDDGPHTPTHTMTLLERRIQDLSAVKDPESYQPTRLAQDDALLTLARAVKTGRWMAGKEVWFLLDDYSTTVIPDIAQEAYNPVIFRLSADVRIKVTCEGYGPRLEDALERKYQEGREYSRVSLGEVYFSENERKCRGFFESILEARFRATNKGSMEKLIRLLGEHPHEVRFGEYIREQKVPGKTTRFHGFGLLCGLCSGDVSFVIELLNQLTEGRWGDDAKPLTPAQQDRIVKRFAARQLASLRRVSGSGVRMHTFAVNLAERIKKYLLESKETADERLRIELEGEYDLSKDAWNAHLLLLRHSVLIDGGGGKDKKGLPTRKLFFRRLFAPCFPFSPARSGSIPITWATYEQWLLRPETITEGKPGRYERDDTGQKTLFEGES